MEKLVCLDGKLGILTIMRVFDANGPDELGAALRNERKSQGLTQEELAAIAGVGVVTIYHLERGKPTIRLDALRAVVAALGLGIALTKGASSDDA